ncbi:hypothetical protein H0H87_009645 [Tephrocybe sp. NHM501043]|nr:hypothetical protein H0H87_009645 [Tephrocybe sp. NHM501043]
MFSSLGLFQSVRCPDHPRCPRPRCLYSHRTDLPPPPRLAIPAPAPAASRRPAASVAPSRPSATPATIPTKRPNATPSAGPPRKVQKLAAAAASATNPHGVPVLRVNPAHSQVPIPVRQTMLKTLFDHFAVLYHALLSTHPSLAADHALKQEDEIYTTSSKLTYRNAVITSCAALKRRPLPSSITHDSVGTEADLSTRAEARKSRQSLRLTRELLEPYIMSPNALTTWGYMLDVPPGPGGTEPTLEGKIAKCERCAQPFLVKRMQEADECVHHWGKPYTAKVNGEKTRLYNCCSRPVSDPDSGCTHGPHVFYESDPADLHARHPFSVLPPPPSSPASSSSTRTPLDVAALDCEMVYTTGGMRVARVSVVDGAGDQVLDEFVKMDDGVEIMYVPLASLSPSGITPTPHSDYVTRFSGITPHNHTPSTATLPLAAIRAALDALIDASTVLIGHALDNDLRTLRIVHTQCVDTVVLFPHRMGAPMRRKLRDLVREHLGTHIQTDDTAGHSSVEDAAATLDLVRHFLLNTPPPPPPPPPPAQPVPKSTL